MYLYFVESHLLLLRIHSGNLLDLTTSSVTDDGVIRAYDALAKACKEACLQAPERITSTNLRKYMATITQVCSLKMKWY